MVLHRLRPDNNPFRYVRPCAEAKRDQLAAELFDNLTRLIIALLLMRIPADTRSADIDSTAVEALDDDEQEVLKAIEQWGELLTPTSKTSVRKRKTRKESDIAKINLNEAAVRFIDDIVTALAELRDGLRVAEESPREPLSS